MDKITAFRSFLRNNTLRSCRKLKQDLEEEVELYLRNKRRCNNDENENILILSTVEPAMAMTSKQQGPRKPKVDRDDGLHQLNYRFRLYPYVDLRVLFVCLNRQYDLKLKIFLMLFSRALKQNSSPRQIKYLRRYWFPRGSNFCLYLCRLVVLLFASIWLPFRTVSTSTIKKKFHIPNTLMQCNPLRNM